jgi:hypothetical protein
MTKERVHPAAERPSRGMNFRRFSPLFLEMNKSFLQKAPRLTKIHPAIRAFRTV